MLLLPCVVGWHAHAQDSSSNAQAAAKKDEGAASKEVAKAKKEGGLVKKLFKELEGFVSDVREKEQQKGVRSHADKRSYEHHYTHLKHRDLTTSSNLPGIGVKGNFDTTTTHQHSDSAKLTSTVFGWHPYWMGDAYKAYNFHLLSMLAYFSYEVDPATGTYKTIHDWATTGIVKEAHAAQCKVLLTITNFGAEANSQFLRNKQAQKNLIDQVTKLIALKQADGVSIDFEGVPAHYKTEWNAFLTSLALGLHQADSSYIVSLTVYPIDEESLYDFNVLNRSIDNYVMMGYDYYGSFSKTAGPIAPLQSGKTWWTWNLERSIDEYLGQGIDTSKFIVAFPYYGAIWETEDLQVPSKSKKFIGHRSYQYIVDTFNIKSTLDTVSKSAFFAYTVQGTGQYRQCWFESDSSLRIKYNYVKSKKLAGIGIWALGFDNGRTDLWKLIEEEFASGAAPPQANSLANDATDTTATADKDSEVTPASLEAAIQLMFRYRALTLLLLAYLVMLVGASFVIAIADYRTRAYFMNFAYFRIYYMAFAFLIVLLALRVLNVFDNGSFLVLLGLIIGAVITVLVNRMLQRKKKMLP